MGIRANTTVVESREEAEELFQYGNQSIVYRFVKRSFDVAASLVGLVILSPVFLATALAIKLEDGGPVIHKRYCVGKNGTYIMYKFRSMKVNADDLIIDFKPDQKERYLRGEKLSDDFRITKVGYFIRKFSIDELPQLYSVLKGDMSLVGPRPVIEREAEEYGNQKEKLLSMRAGITGVWQVEGRGCVPFLSEEAKQMQTSYIDNCSIRLDIVLLLRTVGKVLKREGAR